MHAHLFRTPALPRHIVGFVGFAAALATFAPSGTGAQETWIGVVGGVERTHLGGGQDGALWDVTRVAPAVGLSLRRQVSDAFALRAELRYSRAGGGRRFPTGPGGAPGRDVVVRSQYLELPLGLEVGVPLTGADRVRGALRAGPVAALLLGCEYAEAPATSDDYRELAGGVSCESRQPPGLLIGEWFGTPRSMHVGLAFDALLRMALGDRMSGELSVRWRLGLRTLDAFGNPDVRHRALSVGIGISRPL